METREWALRIFSADTLEEKLLLPEGGLKSLTDHSPGSAIAWSRPPRPEHLRVAGKEGRLKFPHPRSLHQKEMRARCLHAFANHELMALEMMAWALLAFPEAESGFRKGLANILIDEQEHFRLYCQRLSGMGVSFGDLPLNDHFLRAGDSIHDPLDWVCSMHLTFEQANLDHAPYFGRLFQEAGDSESASLMQTIFDDEVRHVRFGTRWLKHYQPEGSTAFETFAQHCSGPFPPGRAVGQVFQEEARRKAGLDEDFIRSLLAWSG